MRVALILALGAGLAAAAPAADFDRAHGLFAQVLKTHVRSGLVDYKALAADRSRLDSYVGALGAVSASELAALGRDDQFAFWINAYNAFTLKAVVDRFPLAPSSQYPRGSIRQIPGVWDRLTFAAAGKPFTLNAIEHEILRARFLDPRLHAAINCASISCPELRNEPYLGDRLETQLTDAARQFAASLARNRIDLTAKTIHASEIFSWFYQDFLKAYAPGGTFAGLSGKDAAAASFLAGFGPAAAAQAIRSGGFRVRFLPYDWNLNDTPR